ncbi:acyltransferase family protein [Massilicoli timonensis]|uniref:acyltransferase family protein n=1 Tax=Massilicoli timonensis TaxID=2015901 RepID=UPI000C85EBC6|nr:acyltransferase [Massilicoli timonensis]
MNHVFNSKMIDVNKNCFNLIRLIAAIQVLFGHAVIHFNLDMGGGLHAIWLSFRGVPVFFILSGFLLWNSLTKKKQSFKEYFRNRVLRLYPELILCVILNSIVITIFMWDQLKLLPFTLFQFTQTTIFQFWTPNFLRAYGVGTPNGSLWTIGVMVQCYIILYLIFSIYRKNKKRLFFIFLIGVLFNLGVPLLEHRIPNIIYKLICQTFIPYYWLFILGALIREYFNQIIPKLIKYNNFIILVLLLISFLNFEVGYGVYETIKSIILAFAFIGFAYKYPKLNIKKDFSYGIYLYHMIIINILIEISFSCDYYTILFVIMSSLCLSYISNKFIKGIVLKSTDRK